MTNNNGEYRGRSIYKIQHIRQKSKLLKVTKMTKKILFKPYKIYKKTNLQSFFYLS